MFGRMTIAVRLALGFGTLLLPFVIAPWVVDAEVRLTESLAVREFLLLLLTFGVFAAAVLFLWIVRGMTRSLGGDPEELRRAVERIAGGDLDGEIDVRPGDTDSLFAAVRALQTGLRQSMNAHIHAEQARPDDPTRLRDALMREVHHRIENSLQTVVSLLRRHGVKEPQAQPAIEAAIAQVRAVAVVHGLYGKVTRSSVMLCELLPMVVESVSELAHVAIPQRGVKEAEGSLLIREGDTVAVALVLNELLTNAVKHSTSDASGSRPQVALTRSGAQGCISISNRGRLPEDFDFESGCAVGTGLGLVRALMPVPGMTLHFRQLGEEVMVEVVIGPPVVELFAGLSQ